MKKIFIQIIAITFVFVSCKKEPEVPKVSYDEKVKSKDRAAKEDTTKIEIADLPIQFEGTNTLIFPIGKMQLSKNYKSSSIESYDGTEANNFKISNNSDNEITGFMTNLKFQKLGQDSLISMSKDKIFIQSISYLKEIAQQSKIQLLVYVLVINKFI